MSEKLSDKVLENQIALLKKLIREWGENHELWFDCGFTSWIEKYDDEPSENPCILMMYFEGPLYGIFNMGHYLADDFYNLIDSKTDFFCQLEDNVTMSFWVKEENPALNAAFRNYFEWKWVSSLIKDGFDDIHKEIYDRINRSPSDLQKLSPRQFEQFLDSVFKNNGYRSQIGPGQADGGVDIRLYSDDGVAEIITLVQAKRYASKNPIKLEAVQALSAVVENERANRGLFVTTSRYLPGVRDFAARQNRRIILADSTNIQEWCALANQKITLERSKILTAQYIQDIFLGKSGSELEGKIFCSRSGYNMHYYSFALVLKESRNTVLAIPLSSIVHSDDGYEQIGMNLPNINFSDALREHEAFRAKKITNGNEISLWGNRERYLLWDGKPTPFNYMD